MCGEGQNEEWKREMENRVKKDGQLKVKWGRRRCGRLE
jgi:hypothetical protein